jgi:hypothetical protein
MSSGMPRTIGKLADLGGKLENGQSELEGI